MLKQTISPSAVAFNLGCDARFAGQGLDANPYASEHEPGEYCAWRLGWLDMERNWARDVFDATALPQVAGRSR